jgi:hypothetical protein
MDKDKLTLEQWQNGLHIRHIAHNQAFSHFKTRDRLLGLISTVLSAVVATTVFASMAESDSNVLIVIAGCISIFATLSAASYSFLKYAQLAERHHQAAASFGQLRRELELMIYTEENVQADKIEAINQRWTELEKDVPAVPQKIYDRASKKIRPARLEVLNEDQE